MRNLVACTSVIGSLLWTLAPSLAVAMPVTESIVFNAIYLPSAPYNPVSGTATITFDTAVTQGPVLVSSFSSALPPAYGPFFLYYKAGFGTDAGLVNIGTTCDKFGCSVSSAPSGTNNQAYLAFGVNADGSPTGHYNTLVYSVSSVNQTFSSTSATVGAINSIPGNSIPEPASITLLSLGITIVLVAAQRQRHGRRQR